MKFAHKLIHGGPVHPCYEHVEALLVYRLKSVEALKMKFVAPMPEQIKTPTMHFSDSIKIRAYVSIYRYA